jgi:hypothetical protein
MSETQTRQDKLALEHDGAWIKGVYYSKGQPLFVEDEDGVPVPIKDSAIGVTPAPTSLA